jgi:hypothetical protein
MVMGPLGRRAVASSRVFAVLVVCGCATAGGGGLSPVVTSADLPEIEAARVVQTCSTFHVDSRRIHITTSAATINLGGGNVLIVPAGAVTAAGFYDVGPINDTAGRRLAGLRIDPVDAAQFQFDEPVELQINYAGCPFEDDTRRFTVVKMNAIGKPNVGGAKSKATKRMRVFLGGLTEFAIAI